MFVAIFTVLLAKPRLRSFVKLILDVFIASLLVA